MPRDLIRLQDEKYRLFRNTASDTLRGLEEKSEELSY